MCEVRRQGGGPHTSPVLTTYLLVCWVTGSLISVGGENLALHKPVDQLGTFEDNTASRAVDGNTDQDLRAGSCAHPYGIDARLAPSRQAPLTTWWVVDLADGHPDRAYTVTGVVIYNRLDCCPDRLVGASIRVSPDNPDVTSHVVCAIIRVPEAVIRARCTPGFPVRYVSVVHTTQPDFTLCEVQVEGHLALQANIPQSTPAPYPLPTIPLTPRPLPPTLTSSTPTSPSDSPLSPTTVAQIAAGCACAMLVVLVVVAVCVYRRTKTKKSSRTDNEQNLEVVIPGSESIPMGDPAAQRSRGTSSVPDSPFLGSERDAESDQPEDKRGAAMFAENQAGFQKLSKLLEKTAVSLPLKRKDIIEKLLKIYWEHPHIIKHHLKVKYSKERGLDWGGLTRDMFSTFWDQITKPGPHAYFKGNDVVVPSLPLHRMRKESWKFIAIGRILTHTAALAKFIPQKLSRSSYLSILFGSTINHKHNILKDFLKYLEEEDRRLVKKAILTFDQLTPEENEALIDFYSRNGLQVLPKAGDIKHQVVNIAEQQLLREPRDLHDLMGEGIPKEHFKAFWSNLTLDHITTQLRKQLPTGQDIISWTVTPEDVSPAETKVLVFLREYLLQLDQPGLIKFLAFVTGSRHFPHEPIAVTFNELSGIQRRPMAQTCANNLQISVHYTSMEDLKREMNQYLSSQYSFDFSIC